MPDSLAVLLHDTEALVDRVRDALNGARGSADETALRALHEGLSSAASAAGLTGKKCGGCQHWKPGEAFAAWGRCEGDGMDKAAWHESHCADHVPKEGT